MKLSQIFVYSLCTAAAAVAAALPVSSTDTATQKYQYFMSDGTEVKLKNNSLPITVGGLAIGTTELPSNNASGAVHPLSSGHHFGHKEWFITPDGDGYSWQYKEGFGSRRANRKINFRTPRNTTEEAKASGRRNLNMHPRTERREVLSDDVDDVLDEIDEILEEEAELFVYSYVIEQNTGILPPYTKLGWSAGGPASYGEMNIFATDDFTVDPILSIASLADDVVNLLFDAWGFFVN